MLWRVACRLRHTWIYRSMTWDGRHRITGYECNFCDAKQTTIDHDLDRDAEGKHPLCVVGAHIWDQHCACYHDPDYFCALGCGATQTREQEKKSC